MIPLFHVDAFADRPFAGNPAAVCLLPGPREAGWMQHVAAEMNLSETAFVHPEGDRVVRAAQRRHVRQPARRRGDRSACGDGDRDYF